MSETPKRLRILAQRYETRAAKLETEAASLRRMAAACRTEAKGLDAALRLPDAGHKRKVTSEMVQAHRVAISEGRSDGSPFLAHIRSAGDGYTMRTLAVALDIAHATLSAHLKPRRHPNHRPIPESRATRILELTGWPADEAHWPAGIVKGR